MSTRFFKDPDAIIDCGIDWSAWLGSDTIFSSAWTVPAPLVLDAQANTPSVSRAYISGGTDGLVTVVYNRIVTTDGRTKDCHISIVVQQRYTAYAISIAPLVLASTATAVITPTFISGGEGAPAIVDKTGLPISDKTGGVITQKP